MPSPTTVSRHYWDSCLFVDLINATPGRHETIEALYDELIVNEPRVIAVTSAFTVAEVAFAKSERRLLEPEVLAKIDAFWDPRFPFEIVELYPSVSLEARSMMREAVALGKKLAAGDAIHFATAKRRGAKVFWTYDKALIALDGKFGFAVRAPVSSTLKFPRSAPVQPSVPGIDAAS
jgi:predicted nucleic acid-binding protein